MGNIKRFDNSFWTIFSVMSCHSQTSSHTISVSISSSFMFQLLVVTVKSVKEAMQGQWPLIALKIEKRQFPDTCAIKGRWPYRSFQIRLYKSLASLTSVAYSWVYKQHRYCGCDPKHNVQLTWIQWESQNNSWIGWNDNPWDESFYRFPPKHPLNRVKQQKIKNTWAGSRSYIYHIYW